MIPADMGARLENYLGQFNAELKHLKPLGLHRALVAHQLNTALSLIAEFATEADAQEAAISWGGAQAETILRGDLRIR